ncbi:MAG: hypothetical protein FJ122_16685 [Deltaproteobacteria bacterium]|nr:hypothetical protein [Deltaproteobacteria bacterium]
MESPWFGGVIMIIIVVGLVVWVWYAMRKKDES